MSRRSAEEVQRFVDTTLGDARTHACHEVDADHAFAGRPLGLNPSPAP
ncbi:hypothetical protein AB0F11_31675 [Streptomyces sp. NPDC032472]